MILREQVETNKSSKPDPKISEQILEGSKIFFEVVLTSFEGILSEYYFEYNLKLCLGL